MPASQAIYQVHSPNDEPLTPGELREIVQRHLVPLGHLQVEVLERARHAGRIAALTPIPTDFVPTLAFDAYARIHRSRWLYRVEAREVEPEDLSYLRSGMLVAGEIAALCEGAIFDVLARQVFGPERVVRQIDRRFNPADHVSVHVELADHPFWVHTHGMTKFGHPDFQLFGVPESSLPVAERLLHHLSAAVVAGGSFFPGERTQLCGYAFSFDESRQASPHFPEPALTLCSFSMTEESHGSSKAGLLACSRAVGGAAAGRRGGAPRAPD